MHKTLTLFVGLSVAVSGFSQAYETSTTFKKKPVPAIAIEVPYTEEIAEGTLISRLDKAGADIEKKGALFWKSNKIDGFLTYKETSLPDLNNNKSDLYFKVVKRRGANSLIYMLVSRGNENFISSTSEPALFDTAKQFMNKMLAQTTSYKWEVDLKNQEDAYNKAQKKLKGLQDDEQDLMKKRKKLEEDLNQNKKDQEAQSQAVATELQKLENLRKKTN